MQRERDDSLGTVTLRSMRLVHLMNQGRWFTVTGAAKAAGMSESGARKMLDRMTESRHMPVVRVKGDDGVNLYGIAKV